MQLRFLDFWGKNHPFFLKISKKDNHFTVLKSYFLCTFSTLVRKITRIFKPLITLI